MQRFAYIRLGYTSDATVRSISKTRWLDLEKLKRKKFPDPCIADVTGFIPNDVRSRLINGITV